MKKFTHNLGRFTMKLVSLLVICGFISLACLPMVHAMQGVTRSDADYGDCQPETTASITTYAEGDEITEGGEENQDTEITEGNGEGIEEEETGDGEDGSEEKTEEDEDPGDTGDPDPTYVTITIQYCDTEGKKITSDKVVDNHPFNTSYRLIAPEIPGYELLDAAEEWTKEIKADTLITIHYKKIVTPVMATLTINYVYEDKSEDNTTHTEQVEVGKPYEVTIPNTDGYTPSIDDDRCALEGYVLKGTMVEGGVEVTVTYTKDIIPPVPPVKYTITIEYKDTSGETIAEDTTEECEAGEHTFIPKEIPGYTAPGSRTIEVTKDETITFAYEKATPKATLIIHYKYEDGSKAADDYTEDIELGKDYRIESPRRANYTPDRNFVTGKINEDDIKTGVVEFTVTYTQNSPDLPVEYTITIYYKDADGKEIAPSTTEVRTAGEHTFEPKEISGYIKPASQTIIVSANDSITFIYEKNPISNPEQPGDEPGADDPQTPTDPKDPTNPDQPADDKPSAQQPSNQGVVSLPTAGASDTMIREFFVIDAGVSTGGIGLWTISGAIRKARRR